VLHPVCGVYKQERQYPSVTETIEQVDVYWENLSFLFIRMYSIDLCARVIEAAYDTGAMKH
jgi:hypothetical protein